MGGVLGNEKELWKGFDISELYSKLSNSDSSLDIDSISNSWEVSIICISISKLSSAAVGSLSDVCSGGWGGSKSSLEITILGIGNGILVGLANRF